VQVNIKFYPHMLFIGRMPRLKANNFFSPLVQTFDEDDDCVVMVEQMINKLQLITEMHGEVLEMSVKPKQGRNVLMLLGKEMFLGFKEVVAFVKMKKQGKKKVSNFQLGRIIFVCGLPR